MTAALCTLWLNLPSGDLLSACSVSLWPVFAGGSGSKPGRSPFQFDPLCCAPKGGWWAGALGWGMRLVSFVQPTAPFSTKHWMVQLAKHKEDRSSHFLGNSAFFWLSRVTHSDSCNVEA